MPTIESEMETKFFQPLDDAGARIAMSKIIGKEALDRKEKILWAQFIALMVARTPESVAKLRSKGRDQFVSEMASIEEDYLKLRSDSDPNTPIEWLQINYPGLMESFGLMSCLKFAEADRTVISFDWHAVEFGHSSKALLRFQIGDPVS